MKKGVCEDCGAEAELDFCGWCIEFPFHCNKEEEEHWLLICKSCNEGRAQDT